MLQASGAVMVYGLGAKMTRCSRCAAVDMKALV